MVAPIWVAWPVVPVVLALAPQAAPAVVHPVAVQPEALVEVVLVVMLRAVLVEHLGARLVAPAEQPVVLAARLAHRVAA